MARPKRFELLTPRFVVWCSIQLSYGRVFREGHHGPDRPDGSESGSETSRKSALATRSGPDWQGPQRGFWQSIWPAGSAEMAAKRGEPSELRPRLRGVAHQIEQHAEQLIGIGVDGKPALDRADPGNRGVGGEAGGFAHLDYHR